MFSIAICQQHFFLQSVSYFLITDFFKIPTDQNTDVNTKKKPMSKFFLTLARLVRASTVVFPPCFVVLARSVVVDPAEQQKGLGGELAGRGEEVTSDSTIDTLTAPSTVSPSQRCGGFAELSEADSDDGSGRLSSSGGDHLSTPESSPTPPDDDDPRREEPNEDHPRREEPDCFPGDDGVRQPSLEVEEDFFSPDEEGSDSSRRGDEVAGLPLRRRLLDLPSVVQEYWSWFQQLNDQLVLSVESLLLDYGRGSRLTTSKDRFTRSGPSCSGRCGAATGAAGGSGGRRPASENWRGTTGEEAPDAGGGEHSVLHGEGHSVLLAATTNAFRDLDFHLSGAVDLAEKKLFRRGLLVANGAGSSSPKAPPTLDMVHQAGKDLSNCLAFWAEALVRFKRSPSYRPVPVVPVSQTRRPKLLVGELVK